CALWVTIDTLAPTKALVSVDLPLFGAPISATKPQRVAATPGAGLSWLTILSRPPDPLAQKHGESRGLLPFAPICAPAARRRPTLDLAFGGEARCVIGAFTPDFEIARQRQAPALGPFLQDGFGIRCGGIDRAELRLPKCPHHALGRLISTIDKHRSQHGL